jgi:hypothetical protein
MVTLYARPFTGRAMLGEKWQPPEEEDERNLHRALLEARDHIHVHADHTAYRAMFDPPRPDGRARGEPPMTIEMAITQGVLLKIADMSTRQAVRFQAEAERLYATFSDVRVPSGSQSPMFDKAEGGGLPTLRNRPPWGLRSREKLAKVSPWRVAAAPLRMTERASFISPRWVESIAHVTASDPRGRRDYPPRVVCRRPSQAPPGYVSPVVHWSPGVSREPFPEPQDGHEFVVVRLGGFEVGHADADVIDEPVRGNAAPPL